jgi:hypothetical protein
MARRNTDTNNELDTIHGPRGSQPSLTNVHIVAGLAAEAEVNIFEPFPFHRHSQYPQPVLLLVSVLPSLDFNSLNYYCDESVSIP